MGLTKKQHIQELVDLPEVAAQLPAGATVDSLYEGEREGGLLLHCAINAHGFCG